MAGTIGSLYLRTGTAEVYQNTDGALAWSQIGAGAGAPAFHGVRIEYATQSIPNASETALVATTETFDTDGYHDNVTNTARLTVPAGKSGYYAITCTVVGVAAATQNTIKIRLNSGAGVGGTILSTSFLQQPGGSAAPTSATSTVYFLAVGNEVQCSVVQNAGIAQNAAAPPSVFQMALLGT